MSHLDSTRFASRQHYFLLSILIGLGGLLYNMLLEPPVLAARQFPALFCVLFDFISLPALVHPIPSPGLFSSSSTGTCQVYMTQMIQRARALRESSAWRDGG